MFNKAFLGLQNRIDLSGDIFIDGFLVGMVTFRILALFLPFIRIVTFSSLDILTENKCIMSDV